MNISIKKNIETRKMKQNKNKKFERLMCMKGKKVKFSTSNQKRVSINNFKIQIFAFLLSQKIKSNQKYINDEDRI